MFRARFLRRPDRTIESTVFRFTIPDCSMRHSSPAASLETVHVRVTGRVQGVGYRLSTVRRAHMIGVRGWVRNNDDGSVEAMVQGTPDQVDAMLEWLRQGPPAARVADLTSEVQYLDKRFDRFEQR
jgi:acylphosphatase